MVGRGNLAWDTGSRLVMPVPRDTAVGNMYYTIIQLLQVWSSCLVIKYVQLERSLNYFIVFKWWGRIIYMYLFRAIYQSAQFINWPAQSRN